MQFRAYVCYSGLRNASKRAPPPPYPANVQPRSYYNPHSPPLTPAPLNLNGAYNAASMQPRSSYNSSSNNDPVVNLSIHYNDSHSNINQLELRPNLTSCTPGPPKSSNNKKRREIEPPLPLAQFPPCRMETRRTGNLAVHTTSPVQTKSCLRLPQPSKQQPRRHRLSLTTATSKLFPRIQNQQ